MGVSRGLSDPPRERLSPKNRRGWTGPSAGTSLAPRLDQPGHAGKNLYRIRSSYQTHPAARGGGGVPAGGQAPAAPARAACEKVLDLRARLPDWFTRSAQSHEDSCGL
eukprot:scaffold375_cov378-Prasinococcus_capsulatus_cf.AAC.11